MKLFEDICRLLPRLKDDEVVRCLRLLQRYQAHFATISTLLYEKLSKADQSRFVIWFLKRWAQINLINQVELSLYNNRIAMVKGEEREEIEYKGHLYKLRDFASQGYPFKLLGYDWFLGVHDIFYDQYGLVESGLTEGSVIIDAGAFVGDTAVLFNHHLGGHCQVHCFELLDENLALLEYNTCLNSVPDGVIHLNKFALTDKTGGTIAIKTGNTQGSTSIFGHPDRGELVETITLDDYVQIMNLSRVDFIKMDIEGSEIPALQGAMQTIRHFKPKLALCLYHKWDDVITIPEFLAETGIIYDYKFKWVQLTDGWEAVLLATPHAGDEPSNVTTHPNIEASDRQWALSALAKIAAVCVK